MTMDISQFDPKKVIESVFKDLKESFNKELKRLGVNNDLISAVRITKSSLTYYAPRVATGKYKEIPYQSVLDEVNELLASHTFTSTESSYWPIVFHNTEHNILSFGNRLSEAQLPVLKYEGKSAERKHNQKYHPRKVTYSIEPSNIILESDNSTPYKAGDKLAVDYSRKTPGGSSSSSELVPITLTYEKKWVSSIRSLGAGRCDSVKEVDYRWIGNYDLGIALGLEGESCIKPAEGESIKEIIATRIKTNSSVKNEFFLENGGNVYYLTNFPDGSEILYFKKFKKKEDAKRKNRPENPETPQCLKKKFKTTFGNIVRKFEFSERKKKKEVRLTFSIKDRAPAATVMLEQLKPFTDKPNFHELKFNTFTKGEVITKKGKGSAKKFALALRPQNHSLPSDFDQEWCHLRGHGDGGEEDASNFISGSKHCNSEQLAIEEGQRLWSRKTGYTLQAKITTYTQPLSVDDKTTEKIFDELLGLLTTKETKEPQTKRSRTNPCQDIGSQDVSIAETLNVLEFFNVKNVKKRTSSFFYSAIIWQLWRTFRGTSRPNSTLSFNPDFRPSYEEMKRECSEGLGNSNLSDVWKNIFRAIELSYLRNFYPRYMRYKVEVRVGKRPTWTKALDHVYLAQSESFNTHEFKILKTTVDRRIAEALGKSDTATYGRRITTKAEAYEIGKWGYFIRSDAAPYVEWISSQTP